MRFLALTFYSIQKKIWLNLIVKTKWVSFAFWLIFIISGIFPFYEIITLISLDVLVISYRPFKKTIVQVQSRAHKESPLVYIWFLWKLHWVGEIIFQSDPNLPVDSSFYFCFLFSIGRVNPENGGLALFTLILFLRKKIHYWQREKNLHCSVCLIGTKNPKCRRFSFSVVHKWKFWSQGLKWVQNPTDFFLCFVTDKVNPKFWLVRHKKCIDILSNTAWKLKKPKFESDF